MYCYHVLVKKDRVRQTDALFRERPTTTDYTLRLRPSLRSYLQPELSAELSALIRETHYDMLFYKFDREQRKITCAIGACPFVIESGGAEADMRRETALNYLRDIACKQDLVHKDNLIRYAHEINKLWRGVGLLVLKAKNEDDERIYELGKIYEILKLERELALTCKDAFEKPLEEDEARWSIPN